MTTPRWPLNGKGTAVMVGSVIVALIMVFQFLGAIPWERKGEVAAAESRLRLEFQRETTSILTQINLRVEEQGKRLEAMQLDIRELRRIQP